MFKFIKLVRKNQNRLSNQVSLCGYLEAIVGHYELYGVGTSDIETLYYDPKVEIYDPVRTEKKNIVAYFFENEHFAFVTSNKLFQLKKDTEGYDITFIEVESFETESLTKENLTFLNRYLDGIVWIDDDFMNDDSIEFNYEAFALIDSGAKYLNPKHFSVEQLVSVYKSMER